MNIKSRSGVTLVEILIGFLLIGSASVIFFQTMHRFRKETAFTTENFLASSLVEKVLEQCYQETELNPYGLEAIGLADKNGKPYNISTYVTDKETVFFARPAITEKATPELYDVLKDNFNLNVTSEKKDGYYELTAGFEWNAKTGNGQAFANTRILSFTGEKEVITTFSLSEDEVRKKIVEDIFNSPGAALETKISSIGAQKLVLSAGYIYYSCVGWLNSDEFKNKLQQAKSLEFFSKPESEEFQKCTELYFGMARDLLHLMLSLKPRLDDFNSQFSFFESIPLPEKFIVASRIEKAGLYYRQLRRIFLNCIFKVTQRYEQQLKITDNQRQQRRLIGRLFNLNRILYVNKDFSEEVSPNQIVYRNKDFLDDMQKFFADKDPSIYRMIDQEKAFIAQNKLRENYFVLKLTNDLFKDIDEFLVVLD